MIKNQRKNGFDNIAYLNLLHKIKYIFLHIKPVCNPILCYNYFMQRY